MCGYQHKNLPLSSFRDYGVWIIIMYIFMKPPGVILCLMWHTTHFCCSVIKDLFIPGSLASKDNLCWQMGIHVFYDIFDVITMNPVPWILSLLSITVVMIPIFIYFSAPFRCIGFFKKQQVDQLMLGYKWLEFLLTLVFEQVLGRSCYNYCIFFFFSFTYFYFCFLRQYLIILPRLAWKSLLTHTGLDFVILLSYLPGSWDYKPVQAGLAPYPSWWLDIR